VTLILIIVRRALRLGILATGHADEHVIEVSAKNPDRCTPDHKCAGHGPDQCTGRDAAMNPCRTAITSTIWSTATCIIRTATIATTTVR